MDNARFADQLQQGCRALGVTVAEDVPPRLFRLMGELLKWNAKVNLTAITAPEEVLEKHFLDSLAVLPEVEGAATRAGPGRRSGLPGTAAEDGAAVAGGDAGGRGGQEGGLPQGGGGRGGWGSRGARRCTRAPRASPRPRVCRARTGADCARLHGPAGLAGPGAGLRGAGRPGGGDAGQGAGEDELRARGRGAGPAASCPRAPTGCRSRARSGRWPCSRRRSNAGAGEGRTPNSSRTSREALASWRAPLSISGQGASEALPSGNPLSGRGAGGT